jgi:putative membrane-bound dehydrogenase-like protein
MQQIKIRVLITLLVVQFSCADSRYSDPLAPQKALESFQLHDGFKIELFASEPHVVDPVDMVFDENGNAFVIEMPDYPFKPESGKGLGRIKMLVDTDGNGSVDKSIVFADSLSEATSMLPWNNGLLVTTAPYILFLKDTNQDFEADEKEILFSGFFANNSEAQITSLRFGIDNWIYAANNGQPGVVTFEKNPEAPPLSMSGADFRFRLDRGQFELETGAAQFGQTMDDWGHRFITQNTLHIRHVVIPWRYLHRHDHLPERIATSLVNISDHDLIMYQETAPPYWRAERTRRRQQQYKEQNLDRQEYAEDHFTGSSGGTVYDGDAFAEHYYGNVFTGDVAGNLVHRDVVEALKNSPTFVAKRHESEKSTEFLTSTDPWFRPANFAIGPDGFLYVIDFYRQHIETPLSIPEDLKEDMDFLNGSKLGRIYRIVPENPAEVRMGDPRKDDQSSSEYVALLAHANRWWRLLAQRILLQRQDFSVVPSLKNMLSTHEDARARLHALYVLEGLNALNAEAVGQAMKDAHPGVREHAIVLSERYPELFTQLVKSIQDSSIFVRFQTTLSLGQSSNEKVLEAFASVLENDGHDTWFRTAVLSSGSGSSVGMLKTLIGNSFFRTPGDWKASFYEDLGYVAGSRHDEGEVRSFLKELSGARAGGVKEWKTSIVSGLVDGLKKSATADDVLKQNLNGLPPISIANIDETIIRLKEFFSKNQDH